jgi:nucleotide-binding universal stress UspA family protein
VHLLISKILVAFDGSETSQRALEFGLDLAEKYCATLTILNVLQVPVYVVPEDPYAMSPDPQAVSPYVVGLGKYLRKSHEKILANAAEKAAALKPNLHVTTELREGNPPAQIIETAVKGKYDLVIVGHGNDSRLREMLLGGTSERVAHWSKCAVLIVK